MIRTSGFRMKLSTKFGLLPLIVALSVAGAGCKNTPKNVTPIPRGTSGPVGNPSTPPPIGNTNPFNNSNSSGGNGRPLPSNPNQGGQDLPLDPTSTGKNTEGNPLPDKDLRYGRQEDRAMFAADTVYFEYDRATLKTSESDKVKRVAEFQKGNPLHDLAVEGHCDERGTEEYNRSLGERRALAVREALVSLGISGSRITTTSFGEDQPADPGHDDKAWEKNRRGEFIILLPSVK
jgi:peptidoglycan-associated lipoprotein